MNKLMRLAALAALVVVCAAPAAAQWPQACAVVVPSSAAISAVVDLRDCGGTYAPTPYALAPLTIVPPDALEATSAALYIHICTTAACTSSKIDAESGTLKLYTIPGGATPTGVVDLAPARAAGMRWIKLQVVTSGGVAVTQTSNRTFTMFVRPL